MNEHTTNKETAKKSGRVKRSRLGRGLSALVEVPVVEVVGPEIGTGNRSDNLAASEGGIALHSPNLQEGVRGGGAGTVDVDGHGGMSGGVRGGRRVVGGLGTDGTEDTGGVGGVGGDERGGGIVEVGDGIGGGVVEIGLELIVANRDQPRRVFDEDALGALAASIREHGLMQPVVVRRIEGGGNGEDQRRPLPSATPKAQTPPPEARGRREEGVDEGVNEGVVYELIAGERRWRASKLAGLETIHAFVRDVDDMASAQLALIENVQREDLNVVELAEGYRVLSDRYSMTQEQIARTVGVSRSSVANITRLLDLPSEVRALIAGGSLSSGHGKVLLSLGVAEKQRKFAARCLKEGWNVRELERACNEEANGADHGVGGAAKLGINTENRAQSVLRDLERRVGEELGTRVRIRTGKGGTRGRLVIEFYDLDQFDGLLGRIGVKIGG